MATGPNRRKMKWAIVAAACVVVAVPLITEYRVATAKVGESTCESNAKMIGLAVLMYAADHNGYLPSANHLPSRQGQPSLVTVLRPWGLSGDAFSCTEDRRRLYRREGLSYNYGFGLLDIGQPSQPANRPWGQDPATFHLLADFGLDWHPHGCTTLFADGHVKVLPRSEFRDYEMREP